MRSITEILDNLYRIDKEDEAWVRPLMISEREITRRKIAEHDQFDES